MEILALFGSLLEILAVFGIVFIVGICCDNQHRYEHAFTAFRFLWHNIMKILALFGIVFIFGNSMQNGDVSSQISGGLLQYLQFLGISEFVLRKMAHFTEFTIEGFLLKGSFKKKSYSLSLLMGLIIALTDETIQLFSEGRGSKVADVWIDFSGVILGNLIYFAICHFKSKKKS